MLTPALSRHAFSFKDVEQEGRAINLPGGIVPE